jgi:drug/metabolite transporter (DMT)-like permease
MPPIVRACSSFPPLLVLLVAGSAISTGAIFARLADSHPLVTAAYRMGLAVLLVLPFALVHAREELWSWPRRSWGVVLLSGACLAAHFATWITSLDYTSVANSVVLVNTHLIWVALLTPLITRERVAARTWYSILIALSGMLVITAGMGSTASSSLWGDGLALLGGLAASFYLLLGRRLRAEHSLLAYVTVCYGSAALILWTLVLLVGLPVVGFAPGTWWAFIGMALVSQTLGHSSYNWALKYLSAGAVAVALLFEPVGSSLLAWLLFDEALTTSQAAGAALILCAIYLAASRPSRRPPAELVA